MNEPQQLSFADAEYANKGKITRREKFLDQLEGLLPWAVMLAVIAPHYAQGSGRGRKPFPLGTMLYVHVAQIVYNYSDPGMEEALYEIESLRRFCGIRLEAVPDENTILQFRHLLEAHGLTEHIFAAINQTLGERGLFLLIRPHEVLSGIFHWLILEKAFYPVRRCGQLGHMLVGGRT